MVFLVSDEVKPKKGGPRMIVTGIPAEWWNAGGTMAIASSGKHSVKMSFSRGTGSTNGTRLNHITPGFAGRFYLRFRV